MIQDLKQDEDKTYKEISEALGVSSKTICKALHHPEKFVDGYERQKAAERPVLGKFVERIEALLKGPPWARGCGRRVRRTSRWVYRQIKKEGYRGAESTVRTYIRQHLKQPRAACPIEHRRGAEVQFDFGQYAVKIADRVQMVYFVGAIFPYSTRRFLFAYPAERQECLFDAIERTYQRAGGITEMATLDNTKLAVKKVLEGRRREETEAQEARRLKSTPSLKRLFLMRGVPSKRIRIRRAILGWTECQGGRPEVLRRRSTSGPWR